MKCIYCGNDESKVLDSRASDNSIRRRRECLNCGRRFTTYETIEAVPFLIIKKDGSKQSYSRDKFKKGIFLACAKRNICEEDIEKIVKDIEKNIQNRFLQELSSAELGKMALDALKNVDDVAYLRYASVLYDFKTIGDFLKFIES